MTEAIEIIQSSKDIHLSWADSKQNPKDVGDQEFHQSCIKRYNFVLEVLNSPNATEKNIYESLEIVEDSRSSHLVWIEFLNKNPDYNTKHVGDIEHHLFYIERYNCVISALKGILK